MRKGTYKRISEKTGIEQKEIKEMFENELKKPVDFKYAEDLGGQDYLKPSDLIIKKAFKFFIEQYLNVKTGWRNYGNIYTNHMSYYAYTKIVKGAVMKYQFVYWLHSKNRNTDTFSFEGNRFELLLCFDYKKMQGLTNEAYVFSYMGGYVFKPTYDSMIYSYKYTEDKKGKQEGGFKWYAFQEESHNYKNLKINQYFKLPNSRIEEHVTQRILTLNPNHVEMLYKMGFKNLYHYRIDEKKVQFLKKNAKRIDKEITKKELSKMYTLVKKGMSIEAYRDFFDVLNMELSLDKYDYDYKQGRKYGYKGYQKLTKTEDTVKIMRIINLAKDFGWEHIKDLRGSCYYLELDFEVAITKGLKERQAIIKEWKEGFDLYKKQQKKTYDKQRRERLKQEKLSKVSFEKFIEKNEVDLEDLNNGSFLIKKINEVEIGIILRPESSNIAYQYEQFKKANEFFKENEIILEDDGDYKNIKKINKDVVDIRKYRPTLVEIFRVCEDYLLSKKIEKVSLETITKKLNKLKKDGFIIEPLKTMKEFEETSEEMNICLMRNEYYNKVKKEKSFIYIAYPENSKEKFDGEVVEFEVKGNSINVSQIHGKENRNTENYEKIKRIVNSLKYNDLVQLQN